MHRLVARGTLVALFLAVAWPLGPGAVGEAARCGNGLCPAMAAGATANATIAVDAKRNLAQTLAPRAWGTAYDSGFEAGTPLVTDTVMPPSISAEADDLLYGTSTTLVRMWLPSDFEDADGAFTFEATADQSFWQWATFWSDHGVRLIITPRTAPTWMKRNLSVLGQHFTSGLAPADVDRYASYLCESIEYAVRVKHLNIAYISLVNEPNVSDLTPADMKTDMWMDSHTLSRLTTLVGRRLAQDLGSSAPGIVGPDDGLVCLVRGCIETPSWLDRNNDELGSNPNLAAVAFHMYTPGERWATQAYTLPLQAKNKPIIVTEIGDNTPEVGRYMQYASALTMAENLYDVLYYTQASLALLWGDVNAGAISYAAGQVGLPDGRWFNTPAGWAFRQWSSWVPGGSRVISATSSITGLLPMFFASTADQRLVGVLVNSGDQTLRATVKLTGFSAYPLPALFQLHQTTDGSYMQDAGDAVARLSSATDGTLVVTLPPRSITTLVGFGGGGKQALELGPKTLAGDAGKPIGPIEIRAMAPLTKPLVVHLQTSAPDTGRFLSGASDDAPALAQVTLTPAHPKAEVWYRDKAAATVTLEASATMPGDVPLLNQLLCTVKPGPATQFDVYGVPAVVPEGNAASPLDTGWAVSITARDKYGNVATGYTGEVVLSSSDPGASFSLDHHKFVSSDMGTWAASLVTFHTPGKQSVKVREKDGTLSGRETVLVAPAAPELITENTTYHVDTQRAACQKPTTELTAGQTLQVRVELVDGRGRPYAATVPTEVTLGSTLATGIWRTTSGLPVRTILVPKGQSDVQVTYSDTAAGRPWLTSRLAGSSTTNVDACETYLAGPATHLKVSVWDDPVTPNQPSDVSVTALDRYGNLAQSYRGTISFTAAPGLTWNAGAHVPVSPTTYTFTSGANKPEYPLVYDDGGRSWNYAVSARAPGHYKISVRDASGMHASATVDVVKAVADADGNEAGAVPAVANAPAAGMADDTPGASAPLLPVPDIGGRHVFAL